MEKFDGIIHLNAVKKIMKDILGGLSTARTSTNPY